MYRIKQDSDMSMTQVRNRKLFNHNHFFVLITMLHNTIRLALHEWKPMTSSRFPVVQLEE